MNYNRVSDSYEEVPTWDKEDAGPKIVLSVLTGNLAYSHKNMNVYFLILQQ
jgi:hypothetical protein